MKISTSISGLLKNYSLEDSLTMLKQAGFEAIDYSITQTTLNWEEGILLDHTLPAFAAHFKKIGETIRKSGLELYQCHAPYARSSISDMDYYARLQNHIIRSVYAAGYMQCPNIVAHPVLHADFCNGQNKELARKITLDYFSAIVPALRETGVTMCIENLFFTDASQPNKIPNNCSNGEDLADLIDTLNQIHGPLFAACLDTGHAILTKNEPSDMVKILGERIRVLHVQDNYGIVDDHLMPSQGIINWNAFATALGQIDYKGTLNFEIKKHFTNLPTDTFSRATTQQACNLLYAIGRSFADIAEGTFVSE